MRHQWIFLTLLFMTLLGCTATDDAPTLPSNANRSYPCDAIKQQLNATYPPELQTRPTAIQKARLLREYDHYGCEG